MLNSQCDGVWRRGLWGQTKLGVGLSRWDWRPCKKRRDQSSPPGRKQREGRACEAGRTLSPRTEFVRTWTLHFPAFRTVRNKCLLFKPHAPWCFARAAQLRQGTHSEELALSPSFRGPPEWGSPLSLHPELPLPCEKKSGFSSWSLMSIGHASNGSTVPYSWGREAKQEAGSPSPPSLVLTPCGLGRYPGSCGRPHPIS